MRIRLAALLLLASLYPALSPVIAAADHGSGTEGEPSECLDGPYGLPGVDDPPWEVGFWSGVLDWPVQSTHMIALPTGKTLMFRGNEIPTTTYVWDPQTWSLTSSEVPDTDLFCSGHVSLSDGRILVTGGTVGPGTTSFGNGHANLFDPQDASWTRAADMNYNRWYPSSTALPDGRVITVAGNINPVAVAEIPEIYNPVTDTWTELLSGQWRFVGYPFNFVMPDGALLHAGPAKKTFRLDLSDDNPSWQRVDTAFFDSLNGSAVTYRPGRILMVGGQDAAYAPPGGTVNDAPAHAHAQVYEGDKPDPGWRIVSNMWYPRRRPDLVMLPTGKALVVGGARVGQDEPSCAVHAAEMWDPATGTFTVMASSERPHVYHSTASLLPDGSVIAGGGENVTVVGGEKNHEIFFPPYWFKGPRPMISVAPGQSRYGEVFRVDSPAAGSIASVALVRGGAATHNFDQNQRFVPLDFTFDSDHLDVTAPENANLAPPGYYMLFIVDDQGRPSHASYVRLADPLCSDGYDNDDDGDVDYPADSDCASPDADTERCSGDEDGDGICNELDNCRMVANPEQQDTNADGYGNACDADFDQNFMVGLTDFARIGAAFGHSEGDPSYDADVDCDVDATIGLADLSCFGSQFGGAPGP